MAAPEGAKDTKNVVWRPNYVEIASPTLAGYGGIEDVLVTAGKVVLTFGHGAQVRTMEINDRYWCRRKRAGRPVTMGSRGACETGETVGVADNLALFPMQPGRPG